MTDTLTKYGARLGIVEPLLRRAVGQVDTIEEVVEALRSYGHYTLSDKLRGVLIELKWAKDYAFPKKR